MFIRYITGIKCLRFYSLLLLIMLVQACGFQLRGALEISQDVSPLYLQQNTVFDLAREIKLLLVTNKIDVTENPTEANSRLILHKESRHNRVLSVDGNGRAREYLLTYTVIFSIEFNRDDVVTETDAEVTDAVVTDAAEVKADADAELAAEEIAAEEITTEPPPESISVSRTLLFDPDAVLAVVNETEILYEDMRRDVARLILLKLQARSANRTVNTNTDVTESQVIQQDVITTQ